MQNYSLLKTVSLFSRLKEEEIGSLLHCLNPRKKEYKKDEYILSTGDPIKDIGIILSGKVHIIKEDYLGNRHIMTVLEKSDLFGEVFVCAGVPKIPVTIYAVSDCEILFIDYQKILTSCSSACTFHSMMIGNMLTILSTKTLLLNQKIEFLTKRTTREKLLTYLSAQSELAASNHFTIPLNRQELADFLCADRSAMSNELSKLKEEGYIDYNKNNFELKM